MTGLLLLSLLPALASARFGVAGGRVDVTPDFDYAPVAFAVQAINDKFLRDGDTAPRQLAEIVSAQSQVVAGQKLYLTLRLTGAELDDYCKVDVWFRAWLNNTDRLIITSGPTCSKTRSRRELLGGISNPNYLKNSLDKEVFDALNFAVCAINDASNDLFFSKLGDTSGVTYTQQVTSGMTYRFYKVPLLTSSCRKQANSCQETDLSTCEVSDNARTTVCTLTVQSQPWLTPAYTLSENNCKKMRFPNKGM
ncbi:hypothetical protein C0Q70_13910 [Pomacea canaliculata]|uniref:Cystatin domain-containing protein n=1 Tax=Pomacea canaliculata TaxID=400727 RepID=A0A2T7NYI7_POMCA|nr:uncharacterized protein LOC112570150 [Pomacea canaliculata]PVD26240.1 hypothetical protein C0Q70_13910 [Pomacea canaliculata]